MNTLLIFIWVCAALVAASFWEAYAEGRNAWNATKNGWVLRISKNVTLPAYHFYLFVVMFPLLLSLPLVVSGWDPKLFGVLVSAYFIGMILEDFFWYVVNPVVKFKELFTEFSDYYPWIRINGRKIIPLGYVINFCIALISWYFLWR